MNRGAVGLIFLFMCAASCQMLSAQDISNTVFDYDDFTGYVELTAAIASSTNGAEIDTYAAADEVGFADYAGAVGVENDVYENGGEIDYSVDEEGSTGAAAFLGDPIDVGQSYTVIATAYSCPYFGEGSTDCYPIGDVSVSMVAGVPQIYSVTPSTDVPGSSGTITVDGNYLLDPFNNQVDSASIGGGVSLSPGGEATQGEITLNYTIPQDATTGPQNLTLTNRFGTSSPATFTVGDHTPVIYQISQPTWQAGITTTGVTFSGQYFGTNLPVLNFSDPAIGYMITSNGDTQIVANITVDKSDPGGTVSVSVTSTGYGGIGFYPGQGQSSTSSQTSGTVVPVAPQVALQRNSLMQITATGAPNGGLFSYTASGTVGTTNASIAIAPGSNQYTNPNPSVLGDPANPSPLGAPSPGGLENIVVQYQTVGGTGTDQFNVPTFGISCYYITLESDWGTAPNSCRNITIKGQTYSGTITNPPNLTGTYCASFIADVKLQGSGVLNSGQAIQYINGVYTPVSVIHTADGATLTPNKTLARDRNIIPTTGVLVDLDQIGTGLSASDTGGAITGYRLDLYKGIGVAVCNNFNNIMSVGGCNPGSSSCPASAIQ